MKPINKLLQAIRSQKSVDRLALLIQKWQSSERCENWSQIRGLTANEVKN